MQSYNKNQGATLLEAVVAMFIFSLGALGLAAMQLTSLVSSGDSTQRSLVIWKAQEFADRIRANESQADQYIAAINRNDWSKIGTDVQADVVACGTTAGFKKPTTLCSDSVDTSGNVVNGASCSAAQTTAYDVWDVFCNPNGGLAASATGSTAATEAQEGSVGVSNMDIALFRNPAAGSDDMVLVIEWLSREAEANTDIASTDTVSTDLCGLQDDREIASSLEVYCLRFSL